MKPNNFPAQNSQIGTLTEMLGGVLILIVLLLSGCTHEPDEKRKNPADFLRAGGDVIINGSSVKK